MKSHEAWIFGRPVSGLGASEVIRFTETVTNVIRDGELQKKNGYILRVGYSLLQQDSALLFWRLLSARLRQMGIQPEILSDPLATFRNRGQTWTLAPWIQMRELGSHPGPNQVWVLAEPSENDSVSELDSNVLFMPQPQAQTLDAWKLMAASWEQRLKCLNVKQQALFSCVALSDRFGLPLPWTLAQRIVGERDEDEFALLAENMSDLVCLAEHVSPSGLILWTRSPSSAATYCETYFSQRIMKEAWVRIIAAATPYFSLEYGFAQKAIAAMISLHAFEMAEACMGVLEKAPDWQDEKFRETIIT